MTKPATKLFFGPPKVAGNVKGVRYGRLFYAILKRRPAGFIKRCVLDPSPCSRERGAPSAMQRMVSTWTFWRAAERRVVSHQAASLHDSITMLTTPELPTHHGSKWPRVAALGLLRLISRPS
jgi:hypothetical protein